MSGALINRSLTTIRTELEFLRDSEVITEALFNRLDSALPQRYQKDSKPWDVDVLNSASSGVPTPSPVPQAPPAEVNKVADSLAKTTISPPAYTPPPQPQVRKPVGYCVALYDFPAQQAEDLNLIKDDKIAIIEHLSEDWWKGYKNGTDPEKAGVFPSNYVRSISEQEFSSSYSEKASYNAPQYNTPPPQQQQPSYGGYAQFPPPSTNYYPPPQQYQPPPPQQVQEVQPQEQQNNRVEEGAKKFGKKLGNAAIFGAGATIGSNIVNSIF
ncbi:PIN3 [[Candida] subhashii]|uniref:PIN3 n=1 Tax=[Candida] subhashii TaxID=561895 RepID=A0A8J5QMH7_9ASCO|nr:PIN3 [[Candida] subhashii]KAG7663083.1 PIN3 [[Candida] subhashii]